MYGADQFVIGELNGEIKTGRTALHDDASVALIDKTVKEIQDTKYTLSHPTKQPDQPVRLFLNNYFSTIFTPTGFSL